MRELKEEAEKKRKEAESQQKRRVFEEANKKMQRKSWNSVPLCLILENVMEKRR